MRRTAHSSTIGTSKTRIELLKSAKASASKFLGKFFFGTMSKLINVLPNGPPTQPSHRDKNFVQGKIHHPFYHRALR